MKILREMAGFLAVAGLLVAGVFIVVASCWNADDWKYYIRLMGDNRPMLAMAGVIYVVLAVLLVAIRFYNRGGDSLSFDREGGRVSIATKVIEDYIAKLSVEFPAITRMNPRVTAARDSIDIVVDVRIKAGPQIKEICEILQQRVRDSMLSGLGIAQVRYVEINVRKIVGQAEPDFKSTSDDEVL
jgi:uncharacterized alkaline shock family protein YloU